MKTQFILVLLTLSFASLLAQPADVTDQLILKLKENAAQEYSENLSEAKLGYLAVDQLSQQLAALSAHRHGMGRATGRYYFTVRFPVNANVSEYAALYRTLDAVEFAEPDYIGHSGGVLGVTPNDAHYGQQWALNNDGSFSLSPAVAGADIEMENAWSIEQGDSQVVVGIIDSGTRLGHPDLAGRIWRNYGEIPGNGQDDDNNGYIDDIRGWNFAYADNDPTDDFGHGTNVTGIIGAKGNNGIGYAGVDWNCKLMILKALDSLDYGYYSWWADGMYYAVDNGASVINMSLAGNNASSLLQDGADYAAAHDVLVVAAMGNLGSNQLQYPGATNGVMAVGSTDANDHRSNPFFWSNTSGSCYGSHISVVAPGNYIFGLKYNSDTDYSQYWGGTSQATPHVAGLAALLLAQNPLRTANDLRSIIESTAEDQVGLATEDVAGWDEYYGAGRINASHALQVFSAAEEGEGEAVSIYPNPNAGRFAIQMTNLLEATISVVDVSGKVLYTETLFDGPQMNLSLDLAAGLYTLIAKADGRVEVKRFLVFER